MTRGAKLKAQALAFVRRFALLALLWWMLVEGRIESPALALALVCAAAAASLALEPRSRVRWRASRAPALFFYMLRMSFAGGWDVARRALAPTLPVRPGLVRYESRLAEGLPSVVFAWLVSLTPGTAAVAIEGRELLVHALDVRLDVKRNLSGLESYVADLFGDD